MDKKEDLITQGLAKVVSTQKGVISVDLDEYAHDVETILINP